MYVFFAFLVGAIFFPVLALIGAVWFLLNGFPAGAVVLFVWWLLWAE